MKTTMKTVLTLGTAAAALAALGACAQRQAEERHYGNDALPSAEVVAFQQADARLHYADARIERDANGCAVYEGRAADGQVRREALADAQGNPICSR